jgi:hypothetical protein
MAASNKTPAADLHVLRSIGFVEILYDALVFARPVAPKL